MTGEEITGRNSAISLVMDFNPLIGIPSKSRGRWCRGWRGMLIYHSSLLNLPSRSKRHIRLTHREPHLSGMQLSWQLMERGNHYKLKISYLISISYFFSRRCIIFPRGFLLGLYIKRLSITVQTRLLQIKPEKGIWLFGAQEKYYFHLSHENDDTKGEIARGWAK